MSKAYDIIGYTADAACWCVGCAALAYPGCDEDDTVVEDGGGNEVHPIVAGDEDADGQGEYCNGCGGVIREPAEVEEPDAPDEDEPEPVCICSECRDKLVDEMNDAIPSGLDYTIDNSVLLDLVEERETRLRCDACGYHEWGDVWYVSPE